MKERQRGCKKPWMTTGNDKNMLVNSSSFLPFGLNSLLTKVLPLLVSSERTVSSKLSLTFFSDLLFCLFSKYMISLLVFCFSTLKMLFHCLLESIWLPRSLLPDQLLSFFRYSAISCCFSLLFNVLKLPHNASKCGFILFDLLRI